MRRMILVPLALLSACGRIDFEPVDPLALALTPRSARSNLNTTTTFVASGGAPPYTLSIATGAGVLDAATGDFLAPSYPGTTVVEASDAAGDLVTADVTYGGDYLYFTGFAELSLGRDEVWRSSDGAQWDLVGHLPAQRSGPSVLVFEDRLLILGGELSVDGMKADNVWASSDGVAWTEIGQLPSPVAAQGFAVHRGRIWLAGGLGAATAVWSSLDGATWQIEASLPLAIHGAVLATYRDELWLVAGHDSIGQSAQLSKRLDDGSWIPIGAVPAAGEYHGVTVRGGLLWVAGGLGLGNRVVTTMDGTSWTDVSLMPEGHSSLTLLEHQDALWVVGGDPASTLRSTDGTMWSTVGAFPRPTFDGSAVSFSPRE